MTFNMDVRAKRSRMETEVRDGGDQVRHWYR